MTRLSILKVVISQYRGSIEFVAFWWPGVSTPHHIAPLKNHICEDFLMMAYVMIFKIEYLLDSVKQ